jgi:Tfp pilus assembly protein PilO
MSPSGSKNAKMPVVLGGLAVVAGYVMIWRPQSSSIAEARQDRRQAEQQLVELEAVSTATTIVVEAADGSTRQLLLAAVPATPELAALLRQLQAIATETGMVMGSMSPMPLTANPAGPGGSVQISMAAAGSREAADAYLGRLRDLERLLVIEQLSVQERAATGAEIAEGAGAAVELPEVQMQVTLRVFTIGGPVVPVDPAAP